MNATRETTIIALAEIRRVLGSGRGIALGLLYLAALLFWSQVILGGAAKMELVVSGPAGTEVGTGFLSSFFQGLLGPDVAQILQDVPPPVLVFVFVGFLVLPGLACVTAHDTIAREVARGTARFVLIRCRRVTWVVGKSLGQAAVLSFFVVACGAGVMAFHSPSLDVFLAGGREFLRYTALMSLYGTTFCACTTAISAGSSRPFLALLVSLASVFALFILAFTRLESLSPFHHAAGFLDPSRQSTAALGCVLIASAMTFMAVWIFRRRDI